MKRAIVASAVALVASLSIGGSHLVGAQTVAEPEPVLGSGSTFAEVALDVWAADVAASEGLDVDYAGVSSIAGLTQFQQGTVDFAASDVPYPEGSPMTRPFAYVPIVAGGTALAFNLVDPGGVRITDLRLSPGTIAGIFIGFIGTWDDPLILADNPHLAGRLQGEIRRAVRTPGAGSTGVFTDYLSTVAPEQWSAWVDRASVVTQGGGNFTTDWPASGNGFDCRCSAFADSNSMANHIGRDAPGSRGAIGYVETAYAIQLGLPVAAVRNASGAYRLPTADNVSAGLTYAVSNADGTADLNGVHLSGRADAYPISSYTYAVIPTGPGLSPGRRRTLGRYLTYAVSDGQAKAQALGYAPLPAQLVDVALDRISLIGDAPEPPPPPPPPPPGTGVLVAEYADATFARRGTELRVAPGEIDDDGARREELEIDLRDERCIGRSIVTTAVQLRTSAGELDGVVLDARAGQADVVGTYTLTGTRTTTPAGRRCARPDPAAASTEPADVTLTLIADWRNARGSVPVVYGGAECGGDGSCSTRDATARATWWAAGLGVGTARSTAGFFYEGSFPIAGPGGTGS